MCTGCRYAVGRFALLESSRFTTLPIKYKISNWYDLREPGALYFSNSSVRPMNEEQKVEFMTIADGETHEIDVPIGDSMPWIGAGLLNQLRVDLGARPGDQLFVEEITLR